jgi:hypothetical protein
MHHNKLGISDKLTSFTFVIGWLCLPPERYREGCIRSIVFNWCRGWTDSCVCTSCQPPYIWWCIFTDSIPISSILQHKLLTKNNEHLSTWRNCIKLCRKWHVANLCPYGTVIHIPSSDTFIIILSGLTGFLWEKHFLISPTVNQPAKMNCWTMTNFVQLLLFLATNKNLTLVKVHYSQNKFLDIYASLYPFKKPLKWHMNILS